MATQIKQKMQVNFQNFPGLLSSSDSFKQNETIEYTISKFRQSTRLCYEAINHLAIYIMTLLQLT